MGPLAMQPIVSNIAVVEKFSPIFAFGISSLQQVAAFSILRLVALSFFSPPLFCFFTLYRLQIA